MAACGGIEAILTIEMLRRGVLLPTRNLEVIDEDCRLIPLLQKPTEARPTVALSNNFAFGGMNTSLVLSPG